MFFYLPISRFEFVSNFGFRISDFAPSGCWMPASVRPEGATHGRIGDHEADCVRDLFGLNEAAELGSRDDALVDVFLSQRPHHWRVGVTGVNDSTANSVEDRLHHECGGGAFQTGFGGGIGDLALVAQ